MFDQRDLFGPAAETIHDRFLEFHEANPDVYEQLVTLARQVKRSGRERWGAKAAFEVLRWKRLDTTGEVWKLNNSFTSMYARMVMQNEADLGEFFETRDRTAA